MRRPQGPGRGDRGGAWGPRVSGVSTRRHPAGPASPTPLASVRRDPEGLRTSAHAAAGLQRAEGGDPASARGSLPDSPRERAGVAKPNRAS